MQYEIRMIETPKELKESWKSTNETVETWEHSAVSRQTSSAPRARLNLFGHSKSDPCNLFLNSYLLKFWSKFLDFKMNVIPRIQKSALGMCRRNLGISAVLAQKGQATDPIQKLFLQKLKEYDQKAK